MSGERQAGYTECKPTFPSFLNFTRFEHGPDGKSVTPVVRVYIRGEPVKDEAKGYMVPGPEVHIDVPLVEWQRMVRDVS